MLVLSLQASVVMLTMLFLFGLRRHFGLSPMYVFIGALQVLQTLGATIFVTTDSGLILSPGSSVMFSAGLVGVLLVYLREDALEARRLIFALLAANLTVGALLFLISIQVQDPAVVNGAGINAGNLFHSSGLLVLGSSLLAVDAVLIVVLYELFARWLPGVFLPMTVTLGSVLAFDSLVFMSVAFWGTPDLVTRVVNSALSKAFIASGYALMCTVYLNRFEREGFALFAGEPPRDVFAILTYRQKYEMARRDAIHDGLTGIFNRAYLQATAKQDVSACIRAQHPLSLLLVDLDHFKQVNDTLGHQAGDDVLRAAATGLAAWGRASDYVCRYGGEEFVMILPNTSLSDASRIAEKLRVEIASLHARGASPAPTTASIGLAALPQDGSTLEELIKAADRRLYRAKANGRNRIEAQG